MSTADRLTRLNRVPPAVQKIFQDIPEAVSPEQYLWRERAARMTLDALGYTNLTVKPEQHNHAVRYARRWFRQMFADHPDPKKDDNAQATFDHAGVDFRSICVIILSTKPFLM